MGDPEGWDYCGWMKKDGEKTKVLGIQVSSGYKERYFVLRKKELYYFDKRPVDNIFELEAPQGLKAKALYLGIIDLSHKVAVTDLEGAKFLIGGESLQRPYHFIARSVEEKENWVKRLKGVCEASGGSVGIADFKLKFFIGEGGWGKVYEVRAKESGKIYAMKVIEKERLQREQDVTATLTERAFLQQFDHPFIVKLHFTFQSTDRLFLIMDFLSGGDAYFALANYNSFKEEYVQLWAVQIILALSYLHEQNVIYRDLKPENIVLDCEGNMILTDFGLSKKTEGGRRKTKVGTPDYMPPEMHQGQEYGPAADFWSLGCFLYELIVGNHPFQTEDGDVPALKVMKDAPQFVDVEMSDNARSFIESLLHKDPEERLCEREKCRAHPWLSGLDWEGIGSKKVKTGFTPNPNDVENFDAQYTSERPILRPAKPGADFEDFSWDEDKDCPSALRQAAAEDGIECALSCGSASPEGGGGAQ